MRRQCRELLGTLNLHSTYAGVTERFSVLLSAIISIGRSGRRGEGLKPQRRDLGLEEGE